tara:strand:- start:560 stop:697 length:138 start_codon:yes stop_codon:yes gene_type:complete
LEVKEDLKGVFLPLWGSLRFIGKYPANLERKKDQLFSKKNVKRAK